MKPALNGGYSYRERLGPEWAGRTALEYLVASHRHSPEAVWRERFEAGQIELCGRRAQGDERLRAGDPLVWHRPPWVEEAVPLSFETLFADAHLLAVAKPSGLPTVPGGGFLDHTLLKLVRDGAPEASPMHRLGRGTSGLVLFALTAAARAHVAQQWREGRVRKVYRALASGVSLRQSFDVDVPIGPVPHPVLDDVFAASPTGKRSHSSVTVVEQREDEVLFDVEIETGRPHQIRIHLAAAGHPLVGDPLYASGGLPIMGGSALPGDTGYLLHAHRLTLEHPFTGRELSLVAPPPARLLSAGEVAHLVP